MANQRVAMSDFMRDARLRDGFTKVVRSAATGRLIHSGNDGIARLNPGIHAAGDVGYLGKSLSLKKLHGPCGATSSFAVHEQFPVLRPLVHVFGNCRQGNQDAARNGCLLMLVRLADIDQTNACLILKETVKLFYGDGWDGGHGEDLLF
jgi:hypothetical protein